MLRFLSRWFWLLYLAGFALGMAFVLVALLRWVAEA